MKTCHKVLLPLALALAAISMCLTASAQSTNIYLASISYGGTGTPQGSVGESISNDRHIFTLIFDSFVASSGPGTPITESRKDSQINLNLSGGPGSVRLTATARGYVQIPAGVSAEVTILVPPTNGHGKAKLATQTFTGPVAMDYTLSHNFKEHLTAATQPVNLHVEVRLIGNLSSPSQVTCDSFDGKLLTLVDDGGGDDDGGN